MDDDPIVRLWDDMYQLDPLLAVARRHAQDDQTLDASDLGTIGTLAVLRSRHQELARRFTSSTDQQWLLELDRLLSLREGALEICWLAVERP